MRRVTANPTDKLETKLTNSGEEYFLRYFGEPTNGLGNFQGSLQEHLFLNHGEQVRGLIRRAKGNLADLLLTSTDPVEKKIERLYLTILQCKPTEREQSGFAEYLKRKEKAETLIEDCIWVLLNSSEFRFNH